VLRHAQEYSPSAQVKAAAAHVQTLKQIQRKKKLSMTLLGVFLEEFRSVGESVVSLTDSVIMTEIDNRLKTQ
jgi:hypothetical protein